MIKIRKKDVVCLPDSSSGHVVDIITADVLTVYKIQKSNSLEIIYIEDSMITLQKRYHDNSLLRLIEKLILLFKQNFLLKWGA